jgi:hypothetical protein
VVEVDALVLRFLFANPSSAQAKHGSFQKCVTPALDIIAIQVVDQTTLLLIRHLLLSMIGLSISHRPSMRG